MGRDAKKAGVTTAVAVTHARVRYIHSNTIETVPIRYFLNFKLKNKDSFRKDHKYSVRKLDDGNRSSNDEEDDSFEYVKANILFLGTSEEDIENQVASGGRVRLPNMKNKFSSSEDEETDYSLSAYKKKKSEQRVTRALIEKSKAEVNSAIIQKHNLYAREQLKFNSSSEGPESPKKTPSTAKELEGVPATSSNKTPQKNLSPPLPKAIQQSDLTKGDGTSSGGSVSGGTFASKYAVQDGMVDLGPGVRIRSDAWDELETCSNSKFVKNLILAVWGDDLANRCLDEKAGARVPGQIRKPLSPQKKAVIQRCFDDRLVLLQGLKGRELKTAKALFGRAITEKINDMNKKGSACLENGQSRIILQNLLKKKVPMVRTTLTQMLHKWLVRAAEPSKSITTSMR